MSRQPLVLTCLIITTLSTFLPVGAIVFYQPLPHQATINPSTSQIASIQLPPTPRALLDLGEETRNNTPSQGCKNKTSRVSTLYAPSSLMRKEYEVSPFSMLDQAPSPAIHTSKLQDPLPSTSTTATYWVDAGATGNGTSIDHPASNISYVLNHQVSASSNDTIKVKPGRYNHTNEMFPLSLDTSSVSLVSTTNASATVINSSETSPSINVSAGNTTINGFTITTYISSELRESGVLVKDVSDTTIIGNHITGPYYGIALAGTCDTMVTDNTIFDNACGMHAESSTNSTVIHNEFTSNSEAIRFVDSSNATITANTLTHNGGGITIEDSSKNKVTGNTVTSNDDGIVLKYSSNNIIYENVMVECGIVLEGARSTFTSQMIADNNTVNGQPIYYYKNMVMADRSVPQDAGQVILANVSGLTMRDLNVSYGSVGVIVGYSTDITITNTTITHHGFEGVYLKGSQAITMSHNTITENRDGILAVDSEDTMIHKNSFTDHELDGIGIFDSQEVTITQNTITNNSFSGISVSHSTLNTITDNLLTHNNRFGLLQSDSNENVIAENTITGNDSGSGIALWMSANSSVRGNVVSNTSRGIWFGATSNSTITANSIANNSQVGLLFDRIYERPSTANLVYRNNILGNGVNAMDRCGENWFNSSTVGNYWGDYRGSDEDGDGIGDTLYNVSGNGGSMDYHPAMDPFSLREEER